VSVQVEEIQSLGGATHPALETSVGSMTGVGIRPVIWSNWLEFPSRNYNDNHSHAIALTSNH
jgi:hypothetical protein